VLQNHFPDGGRDDAIRPAGRRQYSSLADLKKENILGAAGMAKVQPLGRK
jgi:hypothetical protein